MIDLYTVKLNNQYDFIQDVMPSTNGTWLCSKTSTNYKRGYSYQVVQGVATRIEEKQDILITQAIQPTYEVVKKYLGYDRPHKWFAFGLKPCECKHDELPLAVDYYISKIIAYDVFTRTVASDLKSESIGNYSYTKDDYKIGSLYYPAEIASGLDVFKKVKFL